MAPCRAVDLAERSWRGECVAMFTGPRLLQMCNGRVGFLEGEALRTILLHRRMSRTEALSLLQRLEVVFFRGPKKHEFSIVSR